MNDFLKKAYASGRVKKLFEVPSDIDTPEFYIGENIGLYNYKVGDIVFVNNYYYENGKYESNILIKKGNENKLKKDSLVKTDYIYEINNKNINCLIGQAKLEDILLFKEMYLNNNI